jgi:polyhydroxyalkanoate synthesis regulator phasin
MPPTEVKRLEYDLKEKWNHANIEDLKERVDMMEQMNDILSEEIKVLSTLVKDGTKTDGKLDELAKQVLALKSKKRR